MINGIDIAKYQTVDFSTIKVDFCIIKATEGTGYTDPKFLQFQNNFRKLGIGLGYYHFARPDLNSAVSEANWFCSIVKPNKGEMLCLDYEVMSYADPVGWSTAFLNRVHELTGVWCPIYLNQSLANGHDWTPVSKNCGLWLAAYDNDPNKIIVPKSWSNIAMKQYTSSGATPGVPGNTDLDVFYGDLSTFKKYGYQGQSTGGTVSDLPANYPDIIHNSAQWDAVCSTQGLGESKSATADTLNATIAGYKSRITDLGNQLGTLQATETNCTNEVSSLTAQLTTAEADINTLSVKLTDANAAASSIASEKADLVTKLAQLQVQYDTLKQQSQQGQVTMSIGDFFTMLLKGKITFGGK